MAYTATLNGLTLGAGYYVILKGPAGFGIAARTVRVARPSGGTIAASRDVPESRDMVYEVGLLANSPDHAISLMDDLNAAWAPSFVTNELVVEMASSVRTRRGRPRGVDVDLELLRPSLLDAQNGGGSAYIAARCTFDVTDPYWYGGHNSVTAVAGVATGGFVSPFVSPFVSTGTPTASDVSVFNPGTAPAEWTAQLVGPITTPLLLLNGKGVRVDGDIPAGAVGYIDSRTRSFVLDGAVRPWLSHLSNWWTIPPGASTFSLRAAAGTGSAILDFQTTTY